MTDRSGFADGQLGLPAGHIDLGETPTACAVREPHKCTELVWADPENLPEDALDFLGQACSDARTGQVFREYGWAEMAASHPVHPTL